MRYSLHEEGITSDGIFAGPEPAAPSYAFNKTGQHSGREEPP